MVRGRSSLTHAARPELTTTILEDEDLRFLYWADRLGLLVWGEMPAPYEFTTQARCKHRRIHTCTRNGVICDCNGIITRRLKFLRSFQKFMCIPCFRWIQFDSNGFHMRF